MEKQTTVIEINGVKLEVDLRTAKRVDEMRVGTRIKVLKKEYSTHKVFHGVIIGFEPFQKLPTIIVAFANIDYSGAKIEFLYYNAKSEDVEIVVANDDDVAALDKNDFLAHCDREIAKKELEITELRQRKSYFLDKFACYWREVEKAVTDATS